MENAGARASLLQSLRDDVFKNTDILSIIKSHIGCETITDFCLTNKNWCDTVFGNNQLRIEIAQCVMTRINDNLITLRDMLIATDDEWINEPTSVLFLEFGDDYFAAGIQLHEDIAAKFLEEHPMFERTVQNIGKLLALLFNVGVKGESIDTDDHDPHYSNLFIRFNQSIPINIRMRLPFSRIVQDHDDQISLSPVQNLNPNEFSFDDILNWPHLRRTRRRRLDPTK